MVMLVRFVFDLCVSDFVVNNSEMTVIVEGYDIYSSHL